MTIEEERARAKYAPWLLLMSLIALIIIGVYTYNNLDKHRRTAQEIAENPTDSERFREWVHELLELEPEKESKDKAEDDEETPLYVVPLSIGIVLVCFTVAIGASVHNQSRMWND